MKTPLHFSVLSAFCFLSLWLTLAAAYAQTIRFVSTTGTNTNPASATSWATSTTNLQGAIDASAANDQVWVAAGTYKPGGNPNTDRAISFAMKNGVVIYGGFVGNETALSGRALTYPSGTTLSGDIGTPNSMTDNSYHIFYHPNSLSLTASTVLDGFVITGGAGSDKGGGMYNDGNSPSLRNCVFAANSVSEGLSDGGAMYNKNFSSPTLTNCAFQSNSAIGSDQNQGGAMANTNVSSPTLINCSFRDNVCSGGTFTAGGAMKNLDDCDPQLINCSFLNNQCVGGSNFNTGWLFSNNYGSVPKLTNCVVFGSSMNGAIAIYNQASDPVVATYTLFENTVTGYTSDPTNLTTSTSPFVSTNSVELAPGSPAINAGQNSANTTLTDLAGLPRIVNNIIDMGAVEFQEPPSIVAQPATTSTVCEGASVVVPVSVSGSISGYQWLKGGSPVVGQTTATLSLANVQMNDAGVYSLSLTGPTGSTTSNNFTLTVNPLPVVTLTIPVGTTAQGSGGVALITLPANDLPTAFQASGGSSYERLIVLDRTNGYEVRQVDQNTTGIFPITRPGLFTLKVTGPNGCSRTVQGVVQRL